MRKRILVVDDEELIRDFIDEICEGMGYDTEGVAYGKEAMKIIEEGKHYDLVLLDMRLPDMTGIEVIEYIRQFTPSMPVVVMTAYGDVEDAVKMMKNGAIDYILKPFSVDRIEEVFLRILGVATDNIDRGFYGIIGESDVMKRIFQVISVVAESDATVLIEGETGTGKELVASAIHQLSKRKKGPFIRINCAAIPSGLLESELFGHEKGAYTGATQRYIGKFQLADKGTLLLDEIGDMDLGLQAKLLRALQEKEIMPVGSNTTIKVDVRVIATTNADLKKLVNEGKFRKDLYYRLNVIPIKLPPLRERKEDIPLLARFFVHKFSRGKKNISDKAIKILQQQDWDGNVRELKNMMERMCLIVSGSTIEDYHLRNEDLKFVSDNVKAVYSDEILPLKEMEKRLILSTLKKMNWNRTKTAEALGISIRTLRNKLKEYRLQSSINVNDDV